MKAERRHELQTNALARFMANAPELAQKHGGKVLLAVVFVILLGVFIYRQIDSRRQQRLVAADNLALAQEIILRSDRLPASESKKAEAFIATALNGSDDPSIRAQALIARGDYYWAIANRAESAAASTRPSAQAEVDASAAMERAGEAYQAVLAEYASQPIAAANAHFGLAAIEENRAYAAQQDKAKEKSADAHWEAAKKHYEAIQADTAAPPPQLMRDLAGQRITALATIQQPVLLAAATQPTMRTSEVPATGVSVAPAGVRPATRPTTAP